MTFWMAVWAPTPIALIASIAPPYLHLWVDASVLQSQDLAARCVGNERVILTLPVSLSILFQSFFDEWKTTILLFANTAGLLVVK